MTYTEWSFSYGWNYWIRNDAFHEPGHQLNILWQNAVSNLYNLTINELIFAWVRWWGVSHDDQRWITLRSELGQMRVLTIQLYFTVCNHGDHMQTLEAENRRFNSFTLANSQTWTRHCWLLIVYALNVAHDLMMMVLILDSQFIWQ